VVRVAPQPGKAVSAEQVGQFVRQSVAAEGLADVLEVGVEVVEEIPRDPRSGKMVRALNLAGPPGVVQRERALGAAVPFQQV
jgi:hypothetical protein